MEKVFLMFFVFVNLMAIPWFLMAKLVFAFSSGGELRGVRISFIHYVLWLSSLFLFFKGWITTGVIILVVVFYLNCRIFCSSLKSIIENIENL